MNASSRSHIITAYSPAISCYFWPWWFWFAPPGYIAPHSCSCLTRDLLTSPEPLYLTDLSHIDSTSYNTAFICRYYSSMARALRRKCPSWHWNIPSSSKNWIWGSPDLPQTSDFFPAISTSNSAVEYIIPPASCNTSYNSTRTTPGCRSKCDYSHATLSPKPSRRMVNWRAFIPRPWSISKRDF